jgi:hypothetical protein
MAAWKRKGGLERYYDKIVVGGCLIPRESGFQSAEG